MDYRDAVKQLTPTMYRQFKESLAVGKWPDGSEVTEEQKAHLMQAVILYEDIHQPDGPKTGEMSDQCRSKTESDADDQDDSTPLQWQ